MVKSWIGRLAVLSTVAIVTALFLWLEVLNARVQPMKPVPVAVNQLLEYEQNSIEVFDDRSPMVVFVHNLKYYVDGFSFNVMEKQQGMGSGFIWDNQGHVVTNYHVIQGAHNISVTLRNGEQKRAILVGFEEKKDTAVLKIDLDETFPITFNQLVADSETVKVGQKAIAIGNPFGLSSTMTVGAVSALGRSIQSIGGVTIRDMIQSDASINPGNSGGPLLDSLGRLMGMNTAIQSPVGVSAGIGFAVPSNTINRVVTQIINFGKVRMPGIGVVTNREWNQLYLGGKGLLITGFPEGSPAKRAGMIATTRTRTGQYRLGDILIAIDGVRVSNYDDIYNALESRQVGEEVVITFLRGGPKGETKSVKIPLVEID